MAEQIYRHLPEEIITEILSRLSVKTLLRFKCVSKSWRCLISSKHFVKTHLENSKKDESFAHHKIISPSPGPLKYTWMLWECSLSSLVIEPVFTRAFTLDVLLTKINSSERGISIVGSCNGLICLLVDHLHFFLLNPSTRECREMPDFCDGVKQPNKRYYIQANGFGFDEISGDYKIFAVLRNSYTCASVAKVYSLRADSWGRNVFFEYGLMCGSGMFVSGKLHWMTLLEPKLEREVVCFDLKSETFGTLEQPPCMSDNFCLLGVLKGCLCLFFNYGFDIWIWKEYGVKDSWSKMLTIYPRSEHSSNHSLATPCSPVVTPFFALPNDEVMFTCYHHFHIWNPKNDRAMQFHTVNVDFDPRSLYEARVYVESLVSLVRDDDDNI